MRGTLRVRPAYLTLGITGLVLWLGPDFAAKVEYARTKARVERAAMGPRTRRSKWPATLASCLPNKSLLPWCTSLRLLKHHLLMGEDARECVKKFPMDPAGSGTKTATSSPTSMSFAGRNQLKSNWRPVISAEPPSKRADPATDIAVLALNGSRLLPAERAAEAASSWNNDLCIRLTAGIEVQRFQWHCERLGAHSGYSKWVHPNVRRLLADRCPD